MLNNWEEFLLADYFAVNFLNDLNHILWKISENISRFLPKKTLIFSNKAICWLIMLGVVHLSTTMCFHAYPWPVCTVQIIIHLSVYSVEYPWFTNLNIPDVGCNMVEFRAWGKVWLGKGWLFLCIYLLSFKVTFPKPWEPGRVHEVGSNFLLLGRICCWQL